jgi:DNA polymerase III gamma/tau subunit
MSSSYKKRYEEEAKLFSEPDLLRILKIVHDLENMLRFAPQPRYKLEAAMLQLARLESSVQVEELFRRIDDLKKRLQAAPPAAPPAQSLPNVPTSEVRVIGAVSAGPMASPAAMKYSAFYGKPVWGRQGSEPGTVQTSAPSPASRTSEGLTSAMRSEIASRWQEVVSEVLKKRIAVGTTLSESEFLDVDGGAVRISCADEYHLTTLRQHKEYLSETVLKVLGVRVAVEPVLRSGQRSSVITYAPAPEAESKSVIVTAKIEPPAVSDEDPLIAAIRSELGAERVD